MLPKATLTEVYCLEKSRFFWSNQFWNAVHIWLQISHIKRDSDPLLHFGERIFFRSGKTVVKGLDYAL